MQERDITAYQLAKGLGLSYPAVHAWLKGKVRSGALHRVYPSYDQLEALCLFLECTPNDLLQLEATPGKTWRDFAGKGRA